MDILARFLGDAAGAKALLILGVMLLLCGGSACWCKLARWRGSRGCAKPPRRW